MNQIRKMKRILLFATAAMALFLAACKKDDNYIYSQSPDTRINEAIAKYVHLLTGAANGWRAYITVDHGKGATYAFYFKFDSTNRVKMVSDFDTTSSVALMDASYRIREQQQPTLIFDTYSYVHVLSDPNEANAAVVADVNGGDVGGGLYSDFEFIIDKDSIKADTVVLTGKVNGAKLTLIRATATEANIFTTGAWSLVSKYFDKLLTYYKRLTLDGISYDVRFNTQKHEITFNWLDAEGNTQTHTSSYYNTTTGMVLVSPLQNGSQAVSAISVADYTPASQTITINTGASSGQVKETILPLKVDTRAPGNWIQYAVANDGYWASWDGFHVNGVDDAYKINSLGNYYFLSIFPRQYFGTTSEVFAPIFIDSTGTSLELQYYLFVSFSYSATTGIGKFVYKGASSDPKYPTTGPAYLTRTQLIQSNGYYFVQTSETSYDMVSAKDGKAWISWFF